MGMLRWALKMGISIAFDVADFFVGRITGLGTLFDIGGGILGMLLWGGPGALQFLETLDFTDQIDAFIPTLTLAGLIRAHEIWE